MGRLLATLAIAAALGCGGDPAIPDACVPNGECGDPCGVANDKGVGLACNEGGGQCSLNMAPFLFCTADFVDGAEAYCTGPCNGDDDCGADAFCSGEGEGGRGCVLAQCGGVPSLDAGVDAMP